MANRRMDPVRYRRFEAQPLVPEGLLSVAREGGDLERRVAQGLARTAEYFVDRGNQAVQTLRTQEGQQDALAGMPQAGMITGDLAAPSMSDAAPRGIRVTPGQSKGDWLKRQLIADFGLTEAGAAAFAGNLDYESGGFRQLQELQPVIPGSRGGFGWSQWTGPRRVEFERWAAQAGLDPASDEANYGFLRHELANTREGEVLKRLEGVNDPAEAARIVSDTFLRPGIVNMNERIRRTLSYVGSTDSTPIDPASVAYPSVTPVSFTPGSGGTWRPTGSETIGGRAYDVAGTKTYLERLDGVLRSDIRAVYDVHGENPAMLSKALGELKSAHLAEHVFPEIAADYETAFQVEAERYLAASRGQARERAEEQNRADFLQRTYKLEEERSRLLVGTSIDPDLGMAQLQSLQTSLDAHYDSAVARGVMTPEQAVEAKRQSRSTTVEGFYLRHADALDADGVATMRGAMQADYAAGRLEGLDAAGWNRLDAALINRENRLRTEDERAGRALQSRAKSLVDRVINGYEVDPAELTQLQLDAGTATAGGAIAADAAATVEIAQRIRDLPVAEGRETVRQLREAAGPAPTNAEIALIETSEKVLAAKERAIANDPLAWAAAQRIIELSPIDTTSSDSIVESLEKRRIDAEAAALATGEPVPLFRPTEVRAIKGQLASTDPKVHGDTMLQLDYLASQNGITDVAATFGDRAADQLQDWQARLRYSTPEEMTAWLKERSDPQWADRMRPVINEGRRKARDISFEEIVSDLDDNWFFDAAGPVDAETRLMMMNDFETLAAERYAVTRDIGEAREQAVERMRKSWGVTSVYGTRGGRVMPYPPEHHYPAIAGGTDWIGAELADMAGSRGLAIDNLSLVADGKTKAAADRGERPGYLISVIDPETGFDELLTDDQGRIVRHFFDAEAAQEKALNAAAEDRRTRNDPWLVLDDANVTVGPFYPPWRPATAADRRQREQRVKEIANERRIGRRMDEARRRGAALEGVTIMNMGVNDAERP